LPYYYYYYHHRRRRRHYYYCCFSWGRVTRNVAQSDTGHTLHSTDKIGGRRRLLGSGSKELLH
jgi:hypothetical protein